jgi:L-malate glycosyltransferase
MQNSGSKIQSLVDIEDSNKYSYKAGLFYPFLFKILLNCPLMSYVVNKIVKDIFIKMGKLYYQINKKEIKTKVFLFFPWNITGGADKVNLEITHALSEYNPMVIFTDRIDKILIRENYPIGITKINLTRKYIKYLHWVQQFFFTGYISAMINSTISVNNDKFLLLGSNSVLFYKIIENVNYPCEKIDVVHAFIGIEKQSIQLVPVLTHRILITPTLYPKLEKQYKINNYYKYMDRVSVILNGVDIPDSINDKPDNSNLNVIYVGRECPEKRTYLIGRIAKKCKDINIPAQFKLIGVSPGAINSEDLQYCYINGEVTEKHVLESIYHESDILLITSSFEGFPMVIMEGMAHGVVPISTDVGGVKDHIIDGQTGYCVNNSSEEQIVTDIIKIIEFLTNNRKEMKLIQLNVFNYAKQHFSVDKFREKYLELINNLLI